ncbi:hypothetical protein EIP91_001945 [Steccherinum ochraceum]|uniref:Uncharacterized protein n=1 Tax=Steccherinum ochraceum TaxID=92696 RepID=A0A4R0RQA9_9APHY|nr:hypothetical protein EIP91_001945 [Steccherinum ochraceum]
MNSAAAGTLSYLKPHNVISDEPVQLHVPRIVRKRRIPDSDSSGSSSSLLPPSSPPPGFRLVKRPRVDQDSEADPNVDRDHSQDDAIELPVSSSPEASQRRRTGKNKPSATHAREPGTLLLRPGSSASSWELELGMAFARLKPRVESPLYSPWGTIGRWLVDRTDCPRPVGDPRNRIGDTFLAGLTCFQLPAVARFGDYDDKETLLNILVPEGSASLNWTRAKAKRAIVKRIPDVTNVAHKLEIIGEGPDGSFILKIITASAILIIEVKAPELSKADPYTSQLWAARDQTREQAQFVFHEDPAVRYLGAIAACGGRCTFYEYLREDMRPPDWKYPRRPKDVTQEDLDPVAVSSDPSDAADYAPRPSTVRSVNALPDETYEARMDTRLSEMAPKYRDVMDPPEFLHNLVKIPQRSSNAPPVFTHLTLGEPASDEALRRIAKTLRSHMQKDFLGDDSPSDSPDDDSEPDNWPSPPDREGPKHVNDLNEGSGDDDDDDDGNGGGTGVNRAVRSHGITAESQSEAPADHNDDDVHDRQSLEYLTPPPPDNDSGRSTTLEDDREARCDPSMSADSDSSDPLNIIDMPSSQPARLVQPPSPSARSSSSEADNSDWSSDDDYV